MPPLIDIVILLAGLFVIAAVLLLLLRRAGRDTGFAQVPMPVSPTVVQPAEPVAVPVVKPRPKRKRAKPTPAATKPPTPIDRVVGLLKDPDSLATAFLLREILDPPKSRR